MPYTGIPDPVDPYADVPPPDEEYGYSVDASSRDAQEESTEDTVAALLVDGASFLLDIPEGVPAVWGTGDDVLWARGESCLLTGPTGVGKTTLLGLVLMALLGIGEPRVLGLPVVRARRVLYLAMDRPQQIARALSRRVRAEHRATLARAPGGVEGTASGRPGPASGHAGAPRGASRGRRGGPGQPQRRRGRSFRG